jgi:hypothetical protein
MVTASLPHYHHRAPIHKRSLPHNANDMLATSMPFTRREFIGVLGVSAAVRAAGTSRTLILISESDAARMRAALTPRRTALLKRHAAAALAAGPWSVTTHRPSGLNVNAGPHDYVSEGPYWWPDPKNPAGPYIRKDGQRNPQRFMGNRGDLGNMCTAVLALGMGAFFLKQPACAGRAALALSTWFLDPQTRMNPNLEHGQMVRGHNTGRGTGIIDTVSFIHVVQGVTLLELAGGLDPAVASGVRQWFAAYLHWLTTSRNGLDEKSSGNNHATWWTAQAAAYAAFTADAAIQSMCWEHYRNYLVPTEIQPDGSCPREEARTNSLGYSSMNLDAFATVCRLAQMDAVDLWHFRTAKGIGVEKSFYYLIPFVQHPDTWKHRQISRYSPDGYVFPGLAGIGLPSPSLLAAYEELPNSDSPWVQFVDMLVRS